jgi:regulator of protease activity HflC (stomatin/prohibitin superfamily)
VTDLLRLILDTLQAISPVRPVFAWERGVYLVCGRYWRTVGPGLWPVVPVLVEIRKLVTVPEIYPLPLQSVTLRDRSTLTYSASITVIVTDPHLAYCSVGHWSETVSELAAGVLSEGFADADPERFDPARGKRDRLLAELRKQINEACCDYGLSVTALRLNNFVKGVRTLRLLVDRANLGADPK